MQMLATENRPSDGGVAISGASDDGVAISGASDDGVAISGATSFEIYANIKPSTCFLKE